MMRLTLFLLAGCLASMPALAEQGLQLLTATPSEDGSLTYSTSLRVLMIMTAMSLLPALVISMTSFTRIIVVLAILRQALGTGQTPSNQVLLGLALFLSIFIMMPVVDEIYQGAVKPYMEAEISADVAMEAAAPPLRDFMLNQTREKELALYSELSGQAAYESVDDIPFHVLVPSFVTSELKTAFQIGFLIFLPFLVIDLVVASVLMSMGMMMLSPMLISLPFKIMLFVLVDGWTLVLGTLTASFHV
ncbi:MAG: flagellar biosynthetic protein FliP [Candidatus Azotimanducaceae bacterium]|jgi:flagellar biosynthetic protein FliP